MVSGSKKPTGEGVIARAFRGNGRKFELLEKAEGGKGDDLSLIGGVGPKYAAALNKAGIFHMWQIAGMTKQNIAALEATGEFGGHIATGEWVEQARELIAGKPPRAKIDQAAASA